MRRSFALLAVVAAALSACATAQKLDAASDVHALLVSIRDNDPVAFDAHVDRPQLQHEIEQRLTAEASHDKRLAALAPFLGPSLAKLAGDALIQPGVFRAVAEHYGYSRNEKIPGAIAISQALRRLPDGRVCAVTKKDGPCLLDFTQDASGHWRLSGFEGELSMLKLKL